MRLDLVTLSFHRRIVALQEEPLIQMLTLHQSLDRRWIVAIRRIQIAILDHQRVLQRHEESRAPRVALTAAATAQLIVDAPALVPVRADHVQSAKRRHPIAELYVGASTC